MGWRVLPAAVALVALAACATEPDFTLPWWPATRVAAPSPLLDAVGVAPPALTGPGCRRDGFVEGPGLQGAFARFTHGFGVTCRIPPAVDAGPGQSEETYVTFDSRGRAWIADRRTARLSAAQATAAADSLVRRGLGLPGVRPLACGTARWPAGMFGPNAVAVTLRGWRTPEYEALVTVDPPGPESASGHVAHVQVSRLGFAACRPPAVVRVSSSDG